MLHVYRTRLTKEKAVLDCIIIQVTDLEYLEGGCTGKQIRLVVGFQFSGAAMMMPAMMGDGWQIQLVRSPTECCARAPI
jgi:hypothetical protein